MLGSARNFFAIRASTERWWQLETVTLARARAGNPL